ncbi:MAG TPA: PEP-CTERM sorting domain-containing protein [Verrucomicrobiae bacterium]|nr:PEP-CTERM sorting domain-containing protein [Verrucomicrobiae bacterium]
MKNGIKYLVAGLVATGISVGAYANITVNGGTALNTFMADKDLNYLDGNLIEIGTFTVAPTIGSPSLANFVVYGSTLTQSGVSAGVFSFSKTASDTGFLHTQIYVVAFNNATGVGATQEGIYFVNDSNASNWKFPATADFPNSTSFDMQDMFTSGNAVTPSAGSTVVFGSTQRDTVNGDNAVKLALVPEPSTWMLVGTGLLGLLGLRRRRS